MLSSKIQSIRVVVPSSPWVLVNALARARVPNASDQIWPYGLKNFTARGASTPEVRNTTRANALSELIWPTTVARTCRVLTRTYCASLVQFRVSNFLRAS